MTDQDSKPAEAGPEAASAAQGGTPGGDLEGALAEAREAVEKARDQALRAQAEIENVRRRAQRDVESAHKYALERFSADLLPVIDSLERAVEVAGSEAAAANPAAIAEGVGLSLKLFLDTLGKSGIVRVDPLGQPFDPNLHQAVSMVESATAEPGSVVQVLQPGFTLHGRVVRPAMVMVAKAKSAPAGEG